MAVGPRDLVRFIRFLLLPVRRMAAERFRGEGGSLLLTGLALHTDLTLDAPGGGAPAWMLAGIGQEHGFPVPEGGAGRLTEALVRRLEARGGDGALRRRASTSVVVRDRRRWRSGWPAARRSRRPRACSPTSAPRRCTATSSARSTCRRGSSPTSRRFACDHANVQGRLGARRRRPVARRARQPGRDRPPHRLARPRHRVHGPARRPAMSRRRPFVLVGQMNDADPTRSPAGTEQLWAYTHVPQHVRGDAGGDGLTGGWDDGEADRFADRIEAEIESLRARGSGRRSRPSRARRPPTSRRRRQPGGRRGGGGTSAIHQQLVFRPIPGLGRARDPGRAASSSRRRLRTPGAACTAPAGRTRARAAHPAIVGAPHAGVFRAGAEPRDPRFASAPSGTVGTMRHCARPGATPRPSRPSPSTGCAASCG